MAGVHNRLPRDFHPDVPYGRAMTAGSARELIIVYNADGGPFAALADMLHKAISPETYSCSLCAVTYGPVAMRGEWRRFLGGLLLAKRFFHRDDFAVAFPGLAISLPAILLREGADTPCVLVSAQELDAASDLAALIALVRQRLA
ncbi:hypothetical protein [Qipengyuania sediminis]|uniref:hypothetical protein n=1 Tax=Qipengyuania sediminis TaxID=1532023 RepID=UPI001F1084AA|nr:hypothetical protein [Qipengyuania sediminis]